MSRSARRTGAAWRRRMASAALAGMLLSACGSARPTDTPPIKAAGQQMRSIREQCQERRRNGELKSVTEVERCADPGVIAAYQAAGYPYMDLIRFAEAARLAGAEKVDKGELSESEYEHQRLMLRDRVADEIDRRNAETPSRSYPQGLDPATTAQLLDGLSAFSGLQR